MAKKLTLEMKKQIAKEIVSETKRCINLAEHAAKGAISVEEAIKEMVEGCSYLEFHQELLRRVPK